MTDRCVVFVTAACVVFIASPAVSDQSASPAPALLAVGSRFDNVSVRSELQKCQQLIIVTADEWKAVSAQMCCFEREGPEAKWHKRFSCSDAVVGKTGMAWGIGIHRDAQDKATRKKEGDGCAPAGVFRLNTVFGYADASSAGVSRFPYSAVVDTTKGVDDPNSRYYNRIVDAAKVENDWQSFEQMLRPDGLYKWGVVVEHNWTPPVPGAGSCIFLHIWREPGKGTLGCTAAPAEYIFQLVHWLDEAKHPLLVQLPRSEYKAIQGGLGLPSP